MNPSRKKQFLRLGVYVFLFLVMCGYLIFCSVGQGIPCFFYERFHIKCMSCGATRAFFALLQLDFTRAVAFHPVFTLALYPIVGIFAIQDFLLCLYNLISGNDRLSLLRHLFSNRHKRVPPQVGAPRQEEL